MVVVRPCLGKKESTRAPCFGRRFGGPSVPPPLPVSPPLSVYKTLDHFVSFGKNSTTFSAIYLVLVVKIVFRIVIFRKILDGYVTKITKISRKIDTHAIIAEKRDFHVLNGFDHMHEVIGGRR